MTPSQHVADDDQRPPTRTLAEARQRLNNTRRRVFGVLAQDRIGPPVLQIKIKRCVANLPEHRRSLGLHRAVVQAPVRDELDVATGVFQEESGRLDRSRRFAAQRRGQERPKRQPIRLRRGDGLPPALLRQRPVKVDFVGFSVSVSQVRDTYVRRFHCVGQCICPFRLKASPSVKQRAARRSLREQGSAALESEKQSTAARHDQCCAFERVCKR